MRPPRYRKLFRVYHNAFLTALRLTQTLAAATQPRTTNARATRARVSVEKPRGRFLSTSFSNAAGTRAYKLYLPRNYRGRRAPLIVMLHGCAQSADDFARGSQMNLLADEFKCLVAYPEQSVAANMTRCWNWFDPAHQQRDRGEPSIVAGITRQIMHDYAVDEDRVYVAGLSAGGAAAAVLAATYPDLYAAVGVHSGLASGLAHDLESAVAAMGFRNAGRTRTTPGPAAAPVHPTIPMIVFHGDRDTTVHPGNGDRFADESELADCVKHVETGRVPGGRSFTRTTYADADGRAVFENWVIHGLGHAWSGGSAAGSYTDPRGPDASREIARFLLAHRKAG